MTTTFQSFYDSYLIRLERVLVALCQRMAEASKAIAEVSISQVEFEVDGKGIAEDLRSRVTFSAEEWACLESRCLFQST